MTPHAEKITCPVCERVSYHSRDVAEGYCGHCTEWTSSPRPAPASAPTPIEGGWRVRDTRIYHIDIMQMLFGNLRICLTVIGFPDSYERGWCFSKTTLTAVVLRAWAFDPDVGEEPEGWVREVSTGRRNCAAYFPPSPERPHEAYVKDCPHCGNERLER